MKHFPHLMQLLRAAWDGDRAGSQECAHYLATQLEFEGDTAHARMLRFTMQSLMSRDPAAGASKTPEGRPPGPKRSRITTLGSASQIQMGDEDEDIELTFGRWDDDDATTW